MGMIDQVNSAAFSRLDHLLSEWLPDGRVEGAYYVARNPNRADKTLGSFKINRMTCKWRDFATSDPGGNDPISLYRYVKGIHDMAEAAKLLSRDLSINSNGHGMRSINTSPRKRKSVRSDGPWRPLIPVPQDAPPPPSKMISNQVWVYKSENGELLNYIIRKDSPGGVREFYPLSFCEHEVSKKRAWRMRALEIPRPIYGLDLLKRFPDLPVLIVEGEKTCDAARRILNGDAVCISWPGGTNSIEYVDFSPVKNRRIAIWPDNDGPGRECALRLARKLAPSNDAVKIVAPPEDKPQGWDLADAHDEAWDAQTVKAHIQLNSALVELEEPAPAALADQPAAGMTFLASTNHQPPRDSEPASKEVMTLSTVQLLAAQSASKHSIISKFIAGRLSDRLIFDEADRRWYHFDHVWRNAEDGTVERLVMSLLDTILPDGYSSNQFSGILRMVKTDLGREPVNIEGVRNTWNQDRHLVPFKNGVLNLKTRELLPHSPSLMFNWSLPYEFDPQASCPTIRNLMANIAGQDLATMQTLLAFLAATMYGMANLQKYLEIIGKPGAGKSTFIKIAKDLVGEENTVTTSMKQLNENRFETSGLYGKRLAVIPDADQWFGSVETLKSITGQDPIRYEEKNKQQGRPFVYQGMVIVSANQPMQSNDYSTAMARRRIPIFIDRTMDPKKADDRLFDKIRPEMPGLVNWLLGFDRNSIREVLFDVDGIREKHERRSMVETNDVAKWANEMLIAESNCETLIGAKRLEGQRIENSTRDLYPSYVDFCESSGIMRNASEQRFRQALVEILDRYGIKTVVRRTGQGRAIKGIRLRRTGPDMESILDLNIPLLLTDEYAGPKS